MQAGFGVRLAPECASGVFGRRYQKLEMFTPLEMSTPPGAMQCNAMQPGLVPVVEGKERGGRRICCV